MHNPCSQLMAVSFFQVTPCPMVLIENPKPAFKGARVVFVSRHAIAIVGEYFGIITKSELWDLEAKYLCHSEKLAVK